MPIARRLFTLLCVALLLAACSSPSSPLPTGSLSVQITGLPQGTPAAVTVRGPKNFSNVVTGSTVLEDLVPGTYSVEAQAVVSGETTYAPTPTTQTVTVPAGGEVTATVAYAPGTAGREVAAFTFTQELGGTLAGTGFIVVQGGPSFFNPANLTLDTTAGTLSVAAQQGLQFRQENNLENGLGVEVDATGETHVIETTLIKPAFPGDFFQQAGLWFGPDQSNYLKLVVISAGAAEGASHIELRRELGNVSQDAGDRVRTSALTIGTGSSVTLRLSVDPDGTVTGAYAIGGGAMQTVGTLTLPTDLLDSAAGIMASRRNDPTGPLDVVFDRFSVTAFAVPASP